MYLGQSWPVVIVGVTVISWDAREAIVDQPTHYLIRFDGLESADAAAQRRRTLQDIDPTIQAKREQTDEDRMNFGASLAVILATPAIITRARGISKWLARTPTSKLTVIDPYGKTILDISARQAAGLAKKLRARHGER
jgi:hypothetical protein